MRTLIAGFGNPLRGDDGFGVEVARRLAEQSLGDQVKVVDVGIGGIHLAHELLDSYGRAIIVDAMTRSQAPGTLYVEEVLGVEAVQRIDMHLTLPAGALGVAKTLGVLPAHVILVGCEPKTVDELHIGLSEHVSAAADEAVAWIRAFLSRSAPSEVIHRHPEPFTRHSERSEESGVQGRLRKGSAVADSSLRSE
jgi:hydrogenase maturation protease